MSIPENPTLAAEALKGCVILITGAGDGLGRATAIEAARCGATVILLGRTIKKLEATYDLIEKAGFAQPGIVPLNLNGASWNDHQTVAETLEAEFGKLDGIVHCATHFTGFMRLADIPPKDWLDGVQTNLTAAYVLTRSLLPLLEKSSDAPVVFVTDTAGRTPKAYQGVYGITKAAIEAMSATFALEYASTHPQLRFHTFHPGPMRTAVRVRGFSGERGDTAPPPDAAAKRLAWLLSAAGKGLASGTAQ
ncbi:MAG: SDR family NAD(P)-dependent oxidoreductase [Pseudomonadota bacterium]